MKTLKTLVVLLFVMNMNLLAQQKGDYSKEPGYFDFSQFTSIKTGDMTTEVYLEEPLLKMAGKMAEEKNGKVGNMISALKLVKVNEFNIDWKEFTKMETAIESMDKDLLAKQWDRIIKTKSKNDYTNVYVKSGSDGNFVGLVVTSLNKSGKVTFVNIVGRIDLETIGQLSEQFNFPNAGKAKEKEEKEKK